VPARPFVGRADTRRLHKCDLPDAIPYITPVGLTVTGHSFFCFSVRSLMQLRTRQRARWFHRATALLLLISGVVLIPRPLLARSERGAAAIAGTVFDPDGKVVVNAAIAVRNEATNDIRTTTTDGSGRFSVPGLRAAAYTIEVAVPSRGQLWCAGLESCSKPARQWSMGWLETAHDDSLGGRSATSLYRLGSSVSSSADNAYY